MDGLSKALFTLWDYAQLIGAYARINLKAQLEYRGAFLSQVLAMFVNDGVWVVFWVVFFTRFPVLRGWTVEDVITVWAVTASGFGLSATLFGNTGATLARIIAQGQLDMWLLYPRAILPHVLVGKMATFAWGDVLFGYIVYAIFVRPDLPRGILFLLLTLSVMVLFVGFLALSGSLSFFLGNAVGLADQWFFAMITFSTYPAVLFEGLVRVLLFTIIPAMFVTFFPVEALRSLSIGHALVTLAGSLTVLAVSVVVFYIGLKRYESGNLTEMYG